MTKLMDQKEKRPYIPGSETQRKSVTENYLLSVDVLSDSVIEGWSQNIGEIGHRPHLALYADGLLIGETECSRFRKDLLDAGIGDGCYGFSLNMEEPCEISSVELSIVLDQKVEYEVSFLGGSIKVSRSSRKNIDKYAEQESELTSASVKNIYYFDVTDLMFYWSFHRRVSGIQRVQLGYVKYLLSRNFDEFQPIFCFKQVPGSTFFRISAAELSRIIESNYNPNVPDDEWKETIKRTQSRRRNGLEFEPSGLFVVLGAPWVSPEYYQVIADIKNSNNIIIIQLMYDLIPLRRPDLCDQELVRNFVSFAVESLHIADAFLSISEHTKREILTCATELDLPIKPIEVVPMGTELTLPRGATPGDATSPKIKKLLKQEYVLFVSTIEARKNHRFIIDIWRSLIDRHGKQNVPKLVLVGRRGWLVQDLISQLDASRWLGGMVVHLENLSDMELDLLYRNCRFTVFPSLYEGWGLPVSESLRYGKPCVAAKNSSVPEAGGNLATYIDLDDNKMAMEKIARLIEDDEYVTNLSEKMVNEFIVMNWDESTKHLLQKLHDIHSLLSDSGGSADAISEGEISFSPNCLPTFNLGNRIEFGYDFVPEAGALDVTGIMKQYAFYGRGWHALEAWGRWSSAQSAQLCFGVSADDAQSLVLYLGVRLPGYYGGTNVQVLVGAQEMGSFRLNGAGKTEPVRIVIPWECLIEADGRYYVAVTLIIEREIISPPDGRDHRLLGIGVSHMVVCREDDLVSRLSYLEECSGIMSISDGKR